jgi:hypothetical protein
MGANQDTNGSQVNVTPKVILIHPSIHCFKPFMLPFVPASPPLRPMRCSGQSSSCDWNPKRSVVPTREGNDCAGSAAMKTHPRPIDQIARSPMSTCSSRFRGKDRRSGSFGLFQRLFSEHVFPGLYELYPDPKLSIGLARLLDGNQEERCHLDYILKQLMNWQIASDRVFTSPMPRAISIWDRHPCVHQQKRR